MQLQIETIEGVICLIEGGQVTGVTLSEGEKMHLLRNGERIEWRELLAILEKSGGARWETLQEFRRKQKEATMKCVYCADGIGVTDDHTD